MTPTFPIRSLVDVPADRRRGGDVRVLLSPRSVGSTSGFMGTATLAAGERIAEHYHPYSEEFVLVTEGEISAELDLRFLTSSAAAPHGHGSASASRTDRKRKTVCTPDRPSHDKSR